MNEKRSFKAWVTSGKVNRRLCIFTFMFVPVTLLLVFTYIPFFKMIGFSFYDMKYIGEKEFVGLKNYMTLFSDKIILTGSVYQRGLFSGVKAESVLYCGFFCSACAGSVFCVCAEL